MITSVLSAMAMLWFLLVTTVVCIVIASEMTVLVVVAIGLAISSESGIVDLDLRQAVQSFVSVLA